MLEPSAPTQVPLPQPHLLSKFFRDNTWLAGQRIANSGAVQWSDILIEPLAPDTDFQIFGETQGSQPEPYEQDIHLWREGRHAWKVAGDCSCPVGYNMQACGCGAV
jgi:hypothetical protein